VKRARKAAEAAFLQLLKDCTPASAASTNPREFDQGLHTTVHVLALSFVGVNGMARMLTVMLLNPSVRPSFRTMRACVNVKVLSHSTSLLMCRSSQPCERQCSCVCTQGHH
jgi:hypothetical protein